jgi:hypothetical protein
VPHLTYNLLDPVSKVCISTVQRLYSMLRGDELDPELEERSMAELEAVFGDQPREVAYNAHLPPESFDFSSSPRCARAFLTVIPNRSRIHPGSAAPCFARSGPRSGAAWGSGAVATARGVAARVLISYKEPTCGEWI